VTDGLICIIEVELHVPRSFRSVVSSIKISSHAGEGKMRVEVPDVLSKI
jgi:hypothetical protein